MEFYVIEHPLLIKAMSRHAKTLREDVFRYCITYGGDKTQVSTEDFRNQIIAGYNPIVWERAIFYAHPSEIFNAVERATSTTGNLKGGRKKDIDWLKLATEFDYKIWLPKVKNKREVNRIEPPNFDKIISQFAPIYILFADWLLSDFGYTALFNIFDISRRYSAAIIKECMDMVDSPRCRTIEYLLAVVDKELAVRHEEIMRNRELLDNSKKIIDAVVSIATNHSQPVNWDAIDNVVGVDATNQIEFDKVKI